jgi:UDP-N-acetylmuramyl pentapeptide phosphotransferase/UDP-N-acetylglucosamine-1-phosphate transferase
LFSRVAAACWNSFDIVRYVSAFRNKSAAQIVGRLFSVRTVSLLQPAFIIDANVKIIAIRIGFAQFCASSNAVNMYNSVNIVIAGVCVIFATSVPFVRPIFAILPLTA